MVPRNYCVQKGIIVWLASKLCAQKGPMAVPPVWQVRHAQVNAVKVIIVQQEAFPAPKSLVHRTEVANLKTISVRQVQDELWYRMVKSLDQPVPRPTTVNLKRRVR